MFRNLKRTWRWIAIAVTIGLVCCSAALAGKPAKISYTIVKLDDGDGTWRCYPQDVNILGDVVGYVDNAATSERSAAYWKVTRSGGPIQSQLITLTAVAALGINDFGEIVGCGTDPNGQEIGLYWANAEADPLLLPPLNGDVRCGAYAINNQGVVCGYSRGATAQAVAWCVDWAGDEPSVWGPLSLPALNERSFALAITNNDEEGFAQIMGQDGPYHPQTVVVWTVRSLPDGSLTVDPLPRTVVEAGDVRALGLNDGGTICGDAGWPPEAVVWIGDEPQTLHRDKKITSASAQDINNNGTIVGSGDRSQYGPEAVVWPSANDNMILLNNYVGRKSPFVKLLEACAVNEMGEIVGAGLTGEKFEPPFGRAAFLAIPD